MDFIKFRDALAEHFYRITKDRTHLFEVNVDKDELWNLYLDSFPIGENDIFRERRYHDCSCCRSFIRQIGNVVVIKNNKLHTIWDLKLNDDTYQPVTDALSTYIRNHAVSDVYISKFKKIGLEKNIEQTENGGCFVWNHFYLNLPEKFVNRSGKSIENVQGIFRDRKNVFKRSLDEITEDSILTVMELIAQNSLYKGEEWRTALTEFYKYKKEYSKINDNEKELYAWEKSVVAGDVVGRIRNHSFGTLLVDISNGVELDIAVRKYEKIVAPENYKRPNAIFTKKMLESAKKTISELGYLDSLQRRFATLDDITVNNILFSNKDSAKRIIGKSNIFEQMEKEVAISPKHFSRVEEISAKDFIDKVLPTAEEIEAFVENKHESNFVSLIASVNPDAKTLFKWNNGLSWSYSGNITDSNIKQNVKSFGGTVDGVLRFSIQWNESGSDNCDLDAHCIEPKGGQHVYYGSCKTPRRSVLGGQLDVDIIDPNGKVAVENIVWVNKSKMKPGEYKFFVHQFDGVASDGFRAEIEFDGKIHAFEYNKNIRMGQNVDVAVVTLDKFGNFSIKSKLNEERLTKKVWGVSTNQFVPVSVVSYSPNYFDQQNGIGHRHLFFFLKGCLNPETPNGFYNEFLKQELEEHRKVFEALGSKCNVENSNDQLSGIGFSMTKRAELIVKVKGATERVMKIKF